MKENQLFWSAELQAWFKTLAQVPSSDDAAQVRLWIVVGPRGYGKTTVLGELEGLALHMGRHVIRMESPEDTSIELPGSGERSLVLIDDADPITDDDKRMSTFLEGLFERSEPVDVVMAVKRFSLDLTSSSEVKWLCRQANWSCIDLEGGIPQEMLAAYCEQQGFEARLKDLILEFGGWPLALQQMLQAVCQGSAESITPEGLSQQVWEEVQARVGISNVSQEMQKVMNLFLLTMLSDQPLNLASLQALWQIVEPDSRPGNLAVMALPRRMASLMGMPSWSVELGGFVSLAAVKAVLRAYVLSYRQEDLAKKGLQALAEYWERWALNPPEKTVYTQEYAQQAAASYRARMVAL